MKLQNTQLRLRQMSRGPVTFKQRDLTRAIKAALAAGVRLERVWIEVSGSIVLGIANDDTERVVEEVGNPWDKAVAS